MMNSASGTSDEGFFEAADDAGARRRYRALLNTVTDGVYRLSSDYRFVAVNDAFAATTGYQRSALRGAHVSLLFDPDGVNQLVGAVAQQRGSFETTPVELSVQTASGDEIECVVQVSRVSTEAAFQGSLGVVAFGDTTRAATHESEQASHESRVRQARPEPANRVHRICHDVIHALIPESTREDLERRVCERLVCDTAYDFAWIGDMHQQTGRFSERVAAPTASNFDVTAIPFGDNPPTESPEANAVRTHAVQIVTDSHTVRGAEDWREQMRACGYRSMAAIPIVYKGVFYGLLAVYDESPNAFVDADTEPLSWLGESIGHAITAVERKNALVSDSVLQLVFSQDTDTDPLVAASTQGWTLDCERLIRTDPGIVAYGTAEGISQSALLDAVADSTRVDELRILSSGSEEYEIELTTSWGARLAAALADHGGCLTAITIADGEFRFVVEIPPRQDKHRIVELVTEQYPNATLRSQWTVPRDHPAIADFHLAFENRLTVKQRAALKTAFHAGYFEWPRQSTGEDVADRLGVTQATFCEHFRGAERVLFEAVFETTGDDDTVPDSPWEPTDPDPQS